MKKIIKHFSFGFILLVFLSFSREASFQVAAQDQISYFTASMEKMPGFINLYWDDEKGKIWMEITQLDTEILYYPSLTAGLGSNDIGLDRGRIQAPHVVAFKKTGNKLLMVEPNYGCRALKDNKLEKQAVEESFAQSVHWGFEISAEESNRVLVDGTNFFLQDAVGAAAAISRNHQGNCKLDASRSAIYLPRTKSFPKNMEVEATITLTGDQAGAYLRDVTPNTESVTLRMHHSFVELPDDNYQPRCPACW